MSLRPGFALCLPSFTAPGAGLFRVPNWDRLAADPLLDWAERADRDGFDAIWVPDHVMIGKDDAVFDGWTLLAAIAARTGQVRLNLIQGSMLFRHPPQLAKMMATLDHLSGGRVTLFANCGHAHDEHAAYGFDWPKALSDRQARFAEAVELIERLWTEPGPVDHAGAFFATRAAIANPKPVQTPRPPIWFAGSEPETLALTAKIGDGWNTPPATLAQFRDKRAALAEAMAGADRAIDAITVSLETQVLIRPTITELRAALNAIIERGGGPALLDPATDPFLTGRTDDLPSELTETFLIGTPDQVRARIDAYVAAGVDCFGLWFIDFPMRQSYDMMIDLMAGLGTARARPDHRTSP